MEVLNIKSLDDWEITDKILGKGGYAVVYLAYDKKTKISIALKKIQIKNIHPKDLVNIKREINNHKLLSHENIIKLYKYFTLDEYLYVLLEYAHKGNLFFYLHKQNKLYDFEIAKFIYQWVLAIEFIHNKNILHRDIKPENVLITKDDNIKLADFGWSSLFSKQERRYSLCGTEEYMSPEIWENIPQDFSIDIWSIGVLLYELYHKKTPFTNLSNYTLLNKIKTNEYFYSENINKDAKDLISKILVYDKNLRISLDEIKNHIFFKNCYLNQKNQNIISKEPKLLNKKEIIKDKFKKKPVFKKDTKKDLKKENKKEKSTYNSVNFQNPIIKKNKKKVMIKDDNIQNSSKKSLFGDRNIKKTKTEKRNKMYSIDGITDNKNNIKKKSHFNNKIPVDSNKKSKFFNKENKNDCVLNFSFKKNFINSVNNDKDNSINLNFKPKKIKSIFNFENNIYKTSQNKLITSTKLFGSKSKRNNSKNLKGFNNRYNSNNNSIEKKTSPEHFFNSVYKKMAKK